MHTYKMLEVKLSSSKVWGLVYYKSKTVGDSSELSPKLNSIYIYILLKVD